VGDEDRENRSIVGGVYFMKFISIAVLMMGAVLLGISSCATVPKPLAPGELRLLSMLVSENKIIKVNIPFEVNFNFEAAGEPEIRAACFYFSGDGPHCFKVMGVNYGSPGTIQAQIRTKNPGSRRLEGYVLYIRDGKIQSTNVISIYFPVIPQ
jgi:hypothetical protein